MITALVFGCIALLIGAYFALDWWLAGRQAKRSLARARDGQVGDADVDYNVIERQTQMHNGSGGAL